MELIGSCYHCGKKAERRDLKQSGFYVEIKEMKLQIKCELLNLDNKHIHYGLCRECMALTFEEGAKVLRQMSDEDFRSIV